MRIKPPSASGSRPPRDALTTIFDPSSGPDATADGVAAGDGSTDGDGHRAPSADRALEVELETADVAELIAENTHLRARLDTLPIIEQSKGILMIRYQIDAETAFSLLCRWSSRTNIKLRHLSRLLVDAATRDARSRAPHRPPVVGPSLDEVLAWMDDGVVHRRSRSPR